MNDISQMKRRILSYIALVLLILAGGGLGGSVAAYFVMQWYMNHHVTERHNRSENNAINMEVGTNMTSDYGTSHSYNETTRTTTIEQNTLD